MLVAVVADAITTLVKELAVLVAVDRAVDSNVAVQVPPQILAEAEADQITQAFLAQVVQELLL